jgi:hypothetical protein
VIVDVVVVVVVVVVVDLDGDLGRRVGAVPWFGESLLPTKVGASILATVRFPRPPDTPDTGISSIRRCLPSQREGL